ncbi:MAG: transglycosylase domain-containing protein [Selenomonadaceae bacterium]|nr:transglycosylase domain-containing protein [Selenomonadaceae bacterium]
MCLTFVLSFSITFALRSIFEDDNVVESKTVAQSTDNYNSSPTYTKTNTDYYSGNAYDSERNNYSKDDYNSTTKQLPVQVVRYENSSLFDKLNLITSIDIAVNEKIKSIPHYVTVDKIPFFMQQAIISVEDARFYEHKGFDAIGIARAAFVNLEAGKIEEGASTITQQTVKNLFLSQERTFTRKAEELALAVNMERTFTKDKILEVYLNSIYFGSNFYGIYDASVGYFGKEPKDLTIAECAMLAGLPSAPSVYSPYENFRLAKQRQLIVINAMEKANLLSRRAAEDARIEEIVLMR